MKILLLGKNGQLGWELQRSLAPLGEIVAPRRADTNAVLADIPEGVPGMICGNLNQPAELAEAVRRTQPHVIVNAAAYTAVDRAEQEPTQAELVNVAAPQALAEAAAQVGALLVHYSTDYVFDGSGSRPWTEDDIPSPLSVYGRTKLEGERRIQASGCRHLILRTSWVYAARGGNFARTMLRLAAQREAMNVINDQWGAPTGADLLADLSAHAIRHLLAHPDDGGLYHCAAAGQTTWHEYACFVVNYAHNLRPDLQLLTDVDHIRPVPTSDWPTPARRPLNSRLDSSRFASTFNLRLPDWRQGVQRMLDEILVTPPALD